MNQKKKKAAAGWLEPGEKRDYFCAAVRDWIKRVRVVTAGPHATHCV